MSVELSEVVPVLFCAGFPGPNSGPNSGPTNNTQHNTTADMGMMGAARSQTQTQMLDAVRRYS